MTLSCYTGAGHRQIPAHSAARIHKFAQWMAEGGWAVQTGDAVGSDEAFVQGALMGAARVQATPVTWQQVAALGVARVMLPWRPSNTTRERFRGAVLHTLDEAREAGLGPRIDEELKQAMTRTHYANTCAKPGIYRLQARNVMEVLGPCLDTPGRFLVVWAEPDGVGRVKGGTNTAVQVARNHGIPWLNLWSTSDLEMRRAVEEMRP